MSQYKMRVAEQGDHEALLSLERETMPGMLGLKYDSRPNFFKAARLHGDPVLTIVGDAGDELIGKGTIAEQRVWINGEKVQIGYLCGLYCHPQYRRNIYLARGFQLFNELVNPNIPFCFTTISKGNRVARGVLEKQRSFMPTYTYLGDYTVHVLRPKSAKVSPLIQRASENDREEIVRFLTDCGKRRNGFPVIDAERQGDEIGSIPLHDFFLFRDGSIRGVVALWDQRDVRNLIASSYTPMGKVIKLMWNSTLGRGRYPFFPPRGEMLDLRYGSFFCVADDDPYIAEQLLRALLHGAEKAQYVLIGMSQSDPLERVLMERPGYRYTSCIYTVTFGEGYQLDEKPVHLEVGKL